MLLGSCPRNIKYVVAKHLSYYDLTNFLQTCHSCAKLYHDVDFWAYLAVQKFGLKGQTREDYCRLAKFQFISSLMVQHFDEKEVDDHEVFMVIKDKILVIRLSRRGRCNHFQIFNLSQTDSALASFDSQCSDIIDLAHWNSLMLYDDIHDIYYRVNTKWP